MKNIIYSISVFLIVFVSSCYQDCKKYCNEIYGSCDKAECVCVPGSFGVYCDSLYRNNYLGEYKGSGSYTFSTGGAGSVPNALIKINCNSESDDFRQIHLAIDGGMEFVAKVINEKTLEIPIQDLPDGCEVEGSGVFNNALLTLSLTKTTPDNTFVFTFNVDKKISFDPFVCL